MNSKSRIIRNTDEEDAAINRGIAADPDTFEASAEDFKKLKRLGQRGRPRSETTKVLVSIRYDADIVESFRATGAGWQTRMNDALREWMQTHSLV